MINTVDIEKNLDSVTSLITPKEEEEAKELIKGLLKFERPSAYRKQLIVKLWIEEDDVQYIRDEEGKKTGVLKPEFMKENSKWSSIVGLVVAKGPDCYEEDENELHIGPWCKVGDWIMFPRHEGTHFVDHGIPMFTVPDDCAYLVVDDPAYIKRN